ncbi:hypothetical protein HAX54_027650 [Datura stramonium]|uniref:Uncharacterized protein n=1 Tax=Datura stramonium TaxID=4076 RepID=A0ABS8S8Y3_DATST|nr:hypothetical protein [Datura stramonium]
MQRCSYIRHEISSPICKSPKRLGFLLAGNSINITIVTMENIDEQLNASQDNGGVAPNNERILFGPHGMLPIEGKNPNNSGHLGVDEYDDESQRNNINSEDMILEDMIRLLVAQ